MDGRRVVLAGATGMVGKQIWKALSDSDRYELTILVRRSSQPPNGGLRGKIVEVDYDSDEDLVRALEGHEVLVSALGKRALAFQPRLISAAVAAKVQRIIPSEFGGDLLHPQTREFPTYRPKVLVQEQLGRLQEQAGISYTLVFVNCLLDWGMSPEGALLLNPADRTVNLYDGGNHYFSTTRTATVGQAVRAVLDHYDKTANRAVYVHDVAVTQNELLRMAEEATAGDGGPAWSVSHVDTASLEQQARSTFEADGMNLKVFYGFAVRGAFAPGYGGHFRNCDNEMLGIEGMQAHELRELVRRCVSRTQ